MANRITVNKVHRTACLGKKIFSLSFATKEQIYPYCKRRAVLPPEFGPYSVVPRERNSTVTIQQFFITGRDLFPLP